MLAESLARHEDATNHYKRSRIFSRYSLKTNDHASRFGSHPWNRNESITCLQSLGPRILWRSVYTSPVSILPHSLRQEFAESDMFVQEAASLLRLAWAESPGLAIQLAARFPSAKLGTDIRRLLLNFPDKALDEPSGLEIMFGSVLPADVSFQLKVCHHCSDTYSRPFFDTSSIYFIGHLSIPLNLLRSSCLHMAITHSFCSMQ